MIEYKQGKHIHLDVTDLATGEILRGSDSRLCGSEVVYYYEHDERSGIIRLPTVRELLAESWPVIGRDDMPITESSDNAFLGIVYYNYRVLRTGKVVPFAFVGHVQPYKEAVV